MSFHTVARRAVPLPMRSCCLPLRFYLAHHFVRAIPAPVLVPGRRGELASEDPLDGAAGLVHARFQDPLELVGRFGARLRLGCGLVAGGLHSGALAWAPAAFAAAYAVSAYDYHWTLHGWTDAGATLGLVIVLALPPLAACAYAAASAVPGLRRSVVLAVSLGWIGYVALPYVRSWGPLILVLAACALALHASGSAPYRRQPLR